MKTLPFVIHVLLILIFITVNNYGNCRPQTGQPASQPQAGSPLDSSIGNNNNNNINNNNSAISRRGWRGEWRRTDPGTVYSSIWKSSDQPLGKAELYIILALLIGMATVIVGCWLSDNCWSPEPEQHYTIAWHDRHRWI
ncbi:uncharacterized protein LOC114121243 [Aphis gossypii]|uniref:Uncharacterized protein n=1 Tax=Aphis gossypii TaxID=80765 RepID=A0A9P0NLI9_APHGO|nr:uncharacterized protein LOC114121243 [Aphis gossypii]CAH1736237.1 unnamed protein product [Aphis gossypii]